jgi:hypothetical protein
VKNHPIRLIVALALLGQAVLHATTFTVTNISDSGAGSLRSAITMANIDPASTDTIEFNIGSSSKTIDLLSPLPSITGPVTIDGRTQPGFNGFPLVELNGTSAGGTACGLVLNSGLLRVHALVINRFGEDGVRVDNSSHPDDDSDLGIYGCWIGVNEFGNFPAANDGHGIHIKACTNQSVHRIGEAGTSSRNVISGNGVDGIHVTPTVRALTTIVNNHIGLGMDGTTVVANGDDGVEAAPYYFYSNDYYAGETIYGTRIGSTDAGSGNVISGNTGCGIRFPNAPQAYADHLPILRNHIGTDSAGTSKRGNGSYGILTGWGVSCRIGAEGAPNVIGGNTLSGIRLGGHDVSIEHNFIGTNSVSTNLGNGFNGIQLLGGAYDHAFISDCTIGFNGLRGISAEGEYFSWFVRGCRIGVNATGGNIGNGSHGIYASNFSA